MGYFLCSWCPNSCYSSVETDPATDWRPSRKIRSSTKGSLWNAQNDGWMRPTTYPYHRLMIHGTRCTDATCEDSRHDNRRAEIHGQDINSRHPYNANQDWFCLAVKNECCVSLFASRRSSCDVRGGASSFVYVYLTDVSLLAKQFAAISNRNGQNKF